jgi:hypothetical protein
MKAVLCRPRFDSATEHTFAFAAEILQWCQQAGISVIELAEGQAVRQRVEQELTEGVDLFIFYDHGNEDALIGQDEKAVIDLKNCDRLAGKEVFTLACLSAKNLGPEVWRKGGTYWGYTEVVSFATEPDTLPSFQEAFNCGFRYRFIEGDSHESALTRAKETFTHLAFELVDAGKTFAAIFMRENGDNLVYLDAHEPEEKEGCLLTLLKLPIRAFFHS